MPSEELIAAGLIELAKLGLQQYFQAAALAGKTDEQIAALYETEKAKFLARDPANLPDPA